MKPPRPGNQSVLLKAGVPMVALILGGSWALSQFMQTHMDIKDKRSQSVSTRKFDLEEEHKALMKKLNIEGGFNLSRIPRPPDVSETEAKKGRKSQ